MAIEAATLVVWAGGYLCVVFFSTSFAAGLYYLAEVIEEHTKLAHTVIALSSEVTLVVHAALLLWDKMPWFPIMVSAAAHVLYLQLLKTFPFFRVKSWEAVSSIVAAVAATALWMRHFWNSWHTLEYVFGFMLMTTWLVPALLVLSLAANENALPGAEAGAPSLNMTTGKPKKRKNRSLLLTGFSSLKDRVSAILTGRNRPSVKPSLKPHTV